MSAAEDPAPETQAEGRLEQRGHAEQAERDPRWPWAPTPNHRIRAVLENTTPMAWAKRLGGPATSRGEAPAGGPPPGWPAGPAGSGSGR